MDYFEIVISYVPFTKDGRRTLNKETFHLGRWRKKRLKPGLYLEEKNSTFYMLLDA